MGEGWTLAAGGYIDRSYVPCYQDGDQAGDLCWRSDNASASFAGHSGQLVRDSTSHHWKFQSDDGTQVDYVDPTNGGSRSGDYWKVTSTDGTQYFFGRGAVGTGQPSTNSRWTIPVNGNDAGEPCYQAADFAGSFCDQAWRWNLDYVVDRHGNAEAFYYQTEANRYGQDSHGTDVSYTAGGVLSEIDYAMRSGDEATRGAARILFSYAGRCLTTSCPTSGQTGFDATRWPDVPWNDDYCSPTAACTNQPAAPSFFSTRRLDTVHTEYGAVSSPTIVDTWKLDHSFPDPGDGQNAALWLQQVTHTGQGHGAATALTDPPVVFTGLPLPNRLYGPTDLSGADALPLYWKYRISKVLTTAGATISVTYNDPAATSGPLSDQGCATPAGTSLPPRTPSDPANNSKLCFPETWWETAPGGTYPTAPAATPDWFNKYAVTSTFIDPGTGSTTARNPIPTTYSYGTPAWRLNRSPLIPSGGHTYSDWAGFDQVKVVTGSGSDTPQQSTIVKYFQGLNGDPGKTATPSKPVPNASGGSVDDDLWLAGRVWERETTLGPTGPDIAVGYTAPFASSVTSDDVTYQSRFVADSDVRTSTNLFDTTGSVSGSRATETRTSYDSLFRVSQIDDFGDTSTTADDRCQRTSYASDALTNMLAYPAEVETDSVACSTTASVPAQVVSIQRYAYDNQASGALPTTNPLGNVTETDTLAGYSGAAAQWLVDTAGYDALGRVTTATQQRDGVTRTTATSFTPSGAGLVTGISSTVNNPTTAPNGWTTTTAYDPAWGVPTSVTDQNLKLTTARYDALGRLTEVWLPGNAQADDNPPSTRYSYGISQTDGNYVGTQSLGHSGALAPMSYVIYDGLLRPRQTQTPAEGGGRQISDTLYASTGQVAEQTNPYYTDGLAAGSFFQPANRQNVPSTTQYVLDGAGRVTDAKLFVINQGTQSSQPSNVTAWDTVTSYRGDRVTVSPNYDSSHPDINGGTPTTTVYDARGRVTALTQYLGNNLASAATQTTTYGYDRWGNLSSMHDPAGNGWSWTYTLGGRLLSAADPDAGTTTYNSYTDTGQPTSVTDAAGNTLAYTYDALDRKTGEYAGSTTGTKLADWSYDSVADAKGYPAAATRYVSGQPYTTKVLSYDQQYRPTASQLVLPATAPSGLGGTSYTTAVSYNPDGSVANQTEPAVGSLPAETVSYRYSDLGNLLAENSGALSIIARAQYTKLNQVAQYSQGYGAVLSRNYLYDPGTGRLSQDQAYLGKPGTTALADTYVTSANHSYAYDNAGNPTTVADTVPANGAANTMSGSDVQCFSYDGLQQLTEAWAEAVNTSNCTTSTPASAAAVAGVSPYWQSYRYDSVGDRTSLTNHATSVAGSTTTTDTYTLYSTSHRLQSLSHSTGEATGNYSYTAVGNLSTAPGQSFSYDQEQRLATLSAAGQTQSRIYTADGDLLLQTSAAGTTLYLGDTQLSVTAQGSQAVRTYSALGQPQAQRLVNTVGTGSTATNSQAITFLLTNAQGTAATAIDATTGAVTNRYYLPFGGPRTAPAQASSWPDVGHGFLNAPTDPDSGLTHLGARDYDPTLGRFLTVDPLMSPMNPQQNNGYAYANNNPTTQSDPSGLMVACADTCPNSTGKGDGYINAGPDHSFHPSASGGGGSDLGIYNAVQGTMRAQAGAYAHDAYLGDPFNPPAMGTQLHQWLGYQTKCGGDIGYCYAAFQVGLGMSITDADAEARAKAICIGSGDMARYCSARYDNMSGVVAPDPIGQLIQDEVVTLGVGGLLKGLAEGAAAGAAETAGQVVKGPIADAIPKNLPEQLALNAAKEGRGTQIMANLRDAPRLVANYGEGDWVKMQYVLRGTDSNVTVHYFRNLTTKMDVEFKFK